MLPIETQNRKATGLVNKLIDKLAVELHIPEYQFCGPGTHLEKRINRGDIGINPLDAACREHDIAYSNFKDLPNKHIADKILAEKAWKRVKAKDSTLGEKVAASAASGIMKGKRKLGMGLKSRKKLRLKNGEL